MYLYAQKAQDNVDIPMKSPICCSSPSLIKSDNSSALVCQNCGAVIEDTILVSTAGNIFDKKDKIAHEPFVSINHTSFQWRMDYTKKLLPIQIQMNFRRLAHLQIQHTAKECCERSLRTIEPKLGMIRSYFMFSNEIYNHTYDAITKVIRGKYHGGYSIDEVCVATLCYYLKKYCIPYTFQEICRLCVCSRTRINAFFSLLSYRVLPKLGLTIIPIQTTTSIEQYCHKLCNEFYIPIDIQRSILSNAKRIGKMQWINGKLPQGIAGAIVYVIANYLHYRITEKPLAVCMCVSEVTLRVKCRQIHKYLHLK